MDHIERQGPTQVGGVEGLLLELLERGGDTQKVLAELCSRSPEHAIVLRRRVRALTDAGLLGNLPATIEPLVPELLGDFQLIQRLGAGGMGVVYRALQRSLGREVALKLVRPELLFFEGGRERFRREVETVARLSHPGIVPVYSVGEEHGIPFFAMELVRGATLSDALQDLHDRSLADLVGRDLERAVCALCGDESSGAAFFAGTWEETCLRVAREVAEALEHAHRRGVMHRDIKPSNVMLTPGGRVLLLDFGLARQEGVSDLTASGALIGSLPFMPPEVLEGEPPDRRSDVYALGVLLYRMLTLHLPFEATRPQALRTEIVQGKPKPLRRANPRASWEAAAVCLVAMDRDAERRYASAGAVAEDLTSVLERRPIAARPAGPGRLLVRWVQRNPGGAVAAGLALAVVTLGPTGWALQQARAKERVQAQLERADRNYQRAFQALELLTRVATKELSDVPMAEEARRQLLTGACDYYEQLVQQPGSGPEVELERARALLKLGSLRDELDDSQGAESALRQGIAMIEALGIDATSPQAVEFARARWFLGRALARTERGAEAIEVLRSALADLEPRGSSEEGLIVAAQIRCELGRVLRRRGDTAGAVEMSESVIEALDGASFEREARTARQLLAFTHTELAQIEDSLGERESSFEHRNAALALYRALSETAPEDRGLRQNMVVAYSNLGQGYMIDGRDAEAVPHLEAAVEIGERLVREFPGLPRYRYHLAGSLLNLGAAKLRLEDPGGPEAVEGAVEHLRQLVEDQADILEYRVTLVIAVGNLASLRIGEGDDTAALALLDEVVSKVEELPPPRPPEMQRSLCNAWLNRIKANLHLGRVDAAMETARAVAEGGDADTLHVSALLLAGALAPGKAAAERRDDTSALVYELLEKAIDAGLEAPDALERVDLEQLGDDPRLARLRERFAGRRDDSTDSSGQRE